MAFIHLHNHTHYSILEWLPKPKEYVKKAKSLWMSAISITDTNNIHGCHELYKYAKEELIKPILWIEIWLQSPFQNKLKHKIVLLAKNYDWFKNIIELSTIANLRIWSEPFITWEDLHKYSKNIICLSWPISSEISYMVLAWMDEEKIIEKINEYKLLFWEDFYVELLYHDDIPKQRYVTDHLIDLHKKYSFKVVACNNCYYIDKEDKTIQDIIMALWKWDIIENPDRKTLINWDYSFLDEEEISSMFWFIPSSISNTQEIYNKIDIHISIWIPLIPKYELPIEDQKIYDEAMSLEKDNKNIKKLSTDEWYLRYLSYKWLNNRYDEWLEKNEIFNLVQKLDIVWLEKKLTQTSPEELKELSQKYFSQDKKIFLQSLKKDIQDKIDRLEYELVVVHEMWFDAYFLIVADYINWARDHEIPVWPGRWSAAWSLMAYLTWITDIDPLPYNLLFERFLNPARISMPDIDTDFSDTWRDEVIKYCASKYGNDHVAQICTFGTFAARARVKDVGRVMWVDFSEMNELAKLIPEKPWTKLKDALEESLEFKDAYEKNNKYKKIIDNALKIEWNVRQVWLHACAVIIAPEKMTNFTALSHPPKDENAIITQYSAYPLEDLGLLKMDFLWLKNLTVIKRTIDLVKKFKWININIWKIPLDDLKVFEIFSAGDTTWVFQFESEWMRKYLIDLSPNTFEDLIAMVSLYRPGPLAYIPSYVERKHWREQIKYLSDDLYEILKNAWYTEEEIEHEWYKLNQDLWPILDVSYWIAVYQEQLMFIVQYMAWFSLWEADLLRRWIWKKKIEIIEQLKIEFIEKSETYKWYKKETSKYIYEEMIQPRANYSFNKSHRACYAYIAYQTAYLKAYYLTEFLTSLLTSDEENMERVVLEADEAKTKGINVLPPQVNESKRHFTYIDDNNIRFWLKAIKWIWDGPISAILKARKEKKFDNLEDFLLRTWREVVNKKSLEALILSWGLDAFWERWIIFKNIENIINYYKNSFKKSQSSQIGLFDNTENKDTLVLNDLWVFSYEESLSYEKEVIWISISWNVLDWLGTYISRRSKNDKIMRLSFDEIEKLPDKEKAMNNMQVVWFVNDIRKSMTKTGGTMVFLYCQSFLYDFEVTIFPKNYDKYKDIDFKWKIIIVSGNANISTEYKRKSILSQDIKVLTLTQAREQAISMNILDNKKYLKYRDISKKYEEKEDILNSLEQEKIENNECMIIENIKEFVIDIPIIFDKQKLHLLKEFLSTLDKWNIEIFIHFKWQKISTKNNILSLDDLNFWLKNNWF